MLKDVLCHKFSDSHALNNQLDNVILHMAMPTADHRVAAVKVRLNIMQASLLVICQSEQQITNKHVRCGNHNRASKSDQ